MPSAIYQWPFFLPLAANCNIFAPNTEPKQGMVQISQVPGNIDLWLHSAWQPQIRRILGMVAPLLELCHPQAALEAATQD